MIRPILLSLSALALVAGCTPQPVGVGSSTGPRSSSGGAVNAPGENRAGTGASTSGTGATNVPAGQRPPTVPGPILSLDDVPAELKNDAFSYYGFGRKRPITLSITSGGQTRTGAQDVRLLKNENGQADFEIISTDGLELLGRNVFSLRTDGIRVLESEKSKTDPKEFELPANLNPGQTWSSTQSLEEGSRVMKIVLVQKVVGLRRIKTKVGEYEALVVTGTGKGTLDGKPTTMVTEQNFVRDRGNVKYTIRTTTAGKTETTTVEETP